MRSPSFRRVLRRLFRALFRGTVVAVVLLVLGIALLTTYLRRDQRHLFLEARARIHETTVEAWATDSGFRVERLLFLDADGAEVATALVRLPASLAEVRHVLVVYAGQQTREQILDLIPERPDVALVAPLYPRIEPETALEKAAWPARLRSAVFTTVAGGLAADTYLDERLQSTAEGPVRTAVLAVSLGSSFGTIHAVLDGRVDDLLVVHGGGDFPVIVRHIYEGRERPLRAAVLPWVAEMLIDAFDPVHWIDDLSSTRVLVIATRRDRHFPPASAEALYDAAPEPKRILWTDTDHIGASKQAIVDSVMAEVEHYLQGDRDP